MKTLTEIAQEAGFETMLRKGRICGFDRDGDYTEEIEALAELVRAEEREACAKVCDDLHPGLATKRVAEIIRARSNT